MNVRAGSLAALLALAVPLGADADPRWWWDDRQVSARGPVSALDIDVVDGDPATVLLAWIEPPQFFEGALLVTASFDGGCTTCDPIQIQSIFGADDAVAIAAVPLVASDRLSIQVLHADSAGALEVIHDASSVPLSGTPAQRCAALQQLNIASVRTQLARDGATEPDISGEGNDSGRAAFHAVWREPIGPIDGWQVGQARDVTGFGFAWEVLAPIWLSSPAGDARNPRVSVDFLTPVPGLHAADVAFADPFLGEVYSTRSTDSGDTWSATGAPTAGPPALVNLAIPGRTVAPLAFDSAPAPDGVSPLWHAAFWYQDGEVPVFLEVDGQHQAAPTMAAPAWGDDVVVTASGSGRTEGLAASVVRDGPTPERAALFAAWTEGSGLGSSEIVVRGGILDAAAVPAVSVDTFPFPPVRPGDSAVSSNVQVTACAIDDATNACVPNRPMGRARRAVSDEDARHVFLAWIDDRTGGPQVWLKRMDRDVLPTAPTATTSCIAPGQVRATVTFDQVPGCRSAPAVAERIRRYLVYHGTQAGGPYDNTDLAGTLPGVPDTIVIVDDGTLPDPVTVDIDGLPAGVTHYIAVVPEDEARNVSPANFDPTVQRPVPPSNEAIAPPPSGCGPCVPFDFSGPTTATGVDCAVEVSWDPPASGVPPYTYDVLRAGIPIATDLAGTTFTDGTAAWGTPRTYSVRARDACPDGAREAENGASAPVAPTDATPPAVSAPGVTQVADCAVRVDAVVTDACSGPAALVDVVRDGIDVATAVTLPHVDVPPGDGSYRYAVRAADRAGLEATSIEAALDVTGCAAIRCLYRATAPTLDTSGLFVRPRSAEDIAFAPPNDVPYLPCPFASGSPDPDPVLAPGAPPLACYQVTGADVVTLRVTADRALQTVRIAW